MLHTLDPRHRAFWMPVAPPGLLEDVCWKPVWLVGLPMDTDLLFRVPFFGPPSGLGSSSGWTLSVDAYAGGAVTPPRNAVEAEENTRRQAAIFPAVPSFR
ncbi:hypothetical protein Misp01_70400 [Microtetraspora sp. NBRC 13810]|nr:hypothetical protein Misp01_70400 [Microtetraspora sp. NBRC 13810]